MRSLVLALALLTAATSVASAAPPVPRTSHQSYARNRARGARSRSTSTPRGVLNRRQPPQKVATVRAAPTPVRVERPAKVARPNADRIWSTPLEVRRAHYQTKPEQVARNLAHHQRIARRHEVIGRVAWGTTIAMKVASWAAVGYAVVAGDHELQGALMQWAVPEFIVESAIGYVGTKFRDSARSARSVVDSIRDRFRHWVG